MTIDDGVAYGEPFQKATASLRFDGAGVRLDGMNIAKGGGTRHRRGVRRLGLDLFVQRRRPAHSGRDGSRRSRTRARRSPGSPSSRRPAAARSTRRATTCKFRVNDLFVGEEGVGQVTGTLALRGKELSGDVDAASPRLAITGTGRIALTPQADAELTFRFHDSSLDPYVRLFVPKLSPFTTAVASGSIRIVGELADVDHLLVDGTVDTLDMRLFDYALKNAAPIRLALDRQQVRDRRAAAGRRRTRSCASSGIVGLHDERIALQADGRREPRHPAGVLPRRARLGPRRADGGRSTARSREPRVLRQRDDHRRPHPPLLAAELARRDQRHDPLRRARHPARRCDGDDGRRAGAVRRPHRLRRLPARRSERDGARRGHAPAVSGRRPLDGRRRPVAARHRQGADARRHGDRARARSGTGGSTPPGSIFDLGRARPAGGGGGGAGDAAPTVPLRFDIQRARAVDAAGREQPRAAWSPAPTCTLRGTYDRPVLFGHAEVERGEVTFEGPALPDHARHDRLHQPDAHRAVLRRRGGDQRARAGADLPRDRQRAPGTTERLQPSSARIRRCRRPTSWRCCSATCAHATRATPSCARCRTRTQTQTDILTTRATQARWRARSRREVGKVVEQTFGVDTFQLTPSLIDPYSQQTSRLNPSARADHRQAHFGSRLPDVLAQPRHVDQRSDHPARDTTRAIGSRGSCRATRIADLRARIPREARVLMRAAAPAELLLLLALFGRRRRAAASSTTSANRSPRCGW